MVYVPIRVSTLRGDQPTQFDAYVKIAEKYVLYIRKGDSFEGERLTRLKAKKLKKMFILPDQEEGYRQYLARNIEMAYDKGSGKSVVSRAEIIQGAQQSNVEEVFENADSVEAYTAAKDAAGRYVQFLLNEDEALSSVMNITNVDQNIAHHGVTVSTLAVMLANKLGMASDEKVTQILALGALLHDFGHTLNPDLNIARPLSGFSKDELKIYREHPRAGAQTVQTKRHFDKSVINIINEHEEWIDGKGFPQGLPESKCDPLSVIVSSCNRADRYMTFEGVPRDQVIKHMMINAVGCHPLHHIQKLGEIMSALK